MRVNKNFEKLLEKYKEISLLKKISAILEWDMNVNLPREGAVERAAQIAYVTEMLAEKWLEPEFRNLLKKAEAGKNLSQDEAAIVRNLNHQGKYYFKVPKEIIIETAKTAAEAFMVWQEAKKQNKFLDFAPYLKKIVTLNQIAAKHIKDSKNPYDTLLDLFEPGLTSSFCSQIFNKLQPTLTDLVRKIKRSKKAKLEGELTNRELIYLVQDQRQLATFILKKMDYKLDSGRMDVSSHPFSIPLGRHDVRITTWYRERDFRESLSATMHEAGHALHEQGINEEYSQTPLEDESSLAIHESQSRFWENQVGRHPEFIKFLTPTLQAFYPEQLSGVGVETLIYLFNQVNPSLIRVEADEVTYNLHVALRFELENDLINNRLPVEKLPSAWRTKMKKYLGIVPETDREGVLQDVHWSLGSFGYFPTYTLGNLYAAQFTNKIKQELHFDEVVGNGEFGTILAWLRENIHRWGSLYSPEELTRRVTGEKLNPKYFLSYISKKYGQIYNL